MNSINAHAVRREDAAIRKWFAEVSKAVACFEARWTWPTLERIDLDLADDLREQKDLFDHAMERGSNDDIERHGAAMCRGYRMVCAVLEEVGAAAAPDDAYQLGTDIESGTRVAIGIQKAALDQIDKIEGQSPVIFVTPDEVAAMIANPAKARAIASVKRMFPGAVMG
jgi:hypothetical protein